MLLFRRITEDVDLLLKMSNADYDTLNAEPQNWCNKDKGRELQKEIPELFTASQYRLAG